MRSGLRLIYAWQPRPGLMRYEGLTFHCADGLARWLRGENDFDPAGCALAYRPFGSWPAAEAWLREQRP